MAKITKSPHLNKRVKTSKGMGKIVDIEQFRDLRRYGVELDENPFSFPVAYFPKHECEVCDG